MSDISEKTAASSEGKTPVKPDRRNLVVLLAAAMAVIILAAVGFLAQKSCKDFEKIVVGQTQQHLLAIARTVAIRSEEFIEEHLTALQTFSKNPAIKKDSHSKVGHDEPCDEYCPARDFYEEHKRHIDAFTLLDDKGIMLERHPFIANRLGMDHTDKPGVSYVIKEHKPYVSNIFVNNFGKAAISVSAPVFHEEKFVGIVRCMIQLDTIYERFVESVEIGNKGYLQIVNDDGIMTAHPNPEYIGKDIMATRKAAFPDYDWSELEDIVGKMTSGREGVGTYHSVWWDAEEPKFVKKLTAFTPIKLGHELWSVGVTTDYKEVSGPIIVHTWNVNMAAGLLILIFSAAGFWVYRVQREKMKLAAKAEFVEELRLQNDNQKNIFASMEDGVCVIDSQYDVHNINPVLIRDFGACDGQKCYEYFHNRTDVCPWCKNVEVFAGKTVCWERSFPQNGKIYDLIDTPLENPDGSISKLEIFRDITERKQAEEKLQRTNAELETATKKADLMAEEAILASRSKSEFLSNMSHEIRTPMNAVIGFSDLLSDENLNKEQKSYVDTIKEAGQHLLEIIDDILDFSKIEAGKLEAEIKECDLGEMLESINSLMRPSATAKGLDFEVLQTSPLPEHIKTDPTRLRQCLMNLISNAIKFTKSGHVYMNVSLEQEDDDKLYIRFDIEDTGIGIEKEKQAHIFGTFTQAESGTTRKFGGAGLGLAITKKLARLLGGTISLSSEVGKGSIFTIMIPVGVDTSGQDGLDRYDSVKHLQNTEQTEPVTKLSGRILVAEDDPANQGLFEVLLKKTGCQFVIVSDGKMVLEKIKAEDFDIILMDIQMPVMNGYETTTAIREAGIKVPIIAVTAFAMVGDREKCFEAGCNDYISKPLDHKELLEMLQKYLQVKTQV